MQYLTGIDGKNLIFSDKKDPNSDLAIETMDGRIYQCAIYDVLRLSDDIVTVDNQSIRVDTLKFLTIEEALSKISTPDDDFMIKDIDGKLPDPYKVEVPPFTAAVVLAIVKNATPHALSRSQHKKKLTIIRNINEIVESGKGNELTIGKAIELLGYYGLKIEDVLKPEYVISKK